MGFIRAYIDRPQQLWIRKAMFQIHLWLGIGLGLYVIVIGVTGSILVFKEEAVASLVPRLRAPRDPAAPAIDVGTVTRRLAAAATPGDRVMLIAFPSESTPEYQAIAARFKPSPAKVMMSVDPATGDVLGQIDLTASWLGIVHGLHISLLSGPAGFIANGIGSILFLVITATGLFLWWPGIRSWVRAFTVDFRRTWTRVNFDLHNTLGFYTLLLVSFWGVSTVYFVWEDAFVSALSRVTAVTRHEPEPPPVSAPAANAPRADLNALVARAHAIAPELRVHAIMPGLAPKQELTIDFGLHGTGPATTWARTAAAGQVLGVGGPRGSEVLSNELAWHLLIGDETALPAIARRFEECPPHVRLIAVIEVDNESEQQALTATGEADITWVHRQGSSTPTLEAAVAALTLPSEPGLAWAAGEASTARRIRQHLLHDRGLDPGSIKAAAYWRAGATSKHEILAD